MATIAPYPHHYRVQLLDGKLSSGTSPAIVGGPPPQFGGEEGHWSPEELLVGAVSLCLMTTFQSLARRENLVPRRFQCQGDGTLEKTSAGLVFTSIRLSVELAVAPGDEERAEKTLLLAKKYCIVSNALKCPVELDHRVRVG